MKKLTYILVIVTLGLFMGLGIFSSPLLVNATNEFDKEREVFLNITTVSKPQYYMVKSLVGDKHNVEYLFSTEEEIEKFKVDENIINNVSNIDLFIYTGLNYEPWINNLIDNLKKGSIGVINISRGVRPLGYEVNNSAKENPYYFLGYNEYKIALYNIKQSLQERDIKNKDFYEASYNKKIDELNEIIEPLKKEIRKHKNYTVIVNTDEFDYLLKDLGINFIKIKGEPSKMSIDEKILNESNIVFIKDKYKLIKESETVGDVLNEGKLKYDTVELIKFDGKISFEELMINNIKLIVDTFKKLPLQ